MKNPSQPEAFNSFASRFNLDGPQFIQMLIDSATAPPPPGTSNWNEAVGRVHAVLRRADYLEIGRHLPAGVQPVQIPILSRAVYRAYIEIMNLIKR